jgi:hypothetical protein
VARSGAAAGIVLALLLSACRTPAALQPLPASDPRPARLLDAYARDAHERRALRGRARIDVESASGLRLSGRQVVVAERPTRLRVEVLGLFDQALAVLTTDGDRFELFRAQDLSFEEGPLRPEILWEEARIALLPEEAIGVLLGAPLPVPGLEPVRAEGAADGSVRVSLAAPGGAERRRMGFDAQGRLQRIDVLADDGEVLWSAAFGGYAPVGGVPFAHAITLHVAHGDTRAEIRLRDVELNPDLPAGVWSIRPPRAAGLGAGRASPGSGRSERIGPGVRERLADRARRADRRPGS